MPISERIKYYRELRGMTQEQLADAIGVRPQTIYKYEKDIVTNIPIERLKQIAAALGVDARDLVDWFDEDVDQLRDELRTNPALRTLLSASSKLTPDDLRKVIDIVLAINRE